MIQFFNFINKGRLYQRNYPVFEARVIRNCLCFSLKHELKGIGCYGSEHVSDL